VIGTGDPPLPGGTSPPHALATGAVFARRYKLVRRLSAGGMAEVYEAEHVNTHRRVAVKVLHPEVMADPTAVERFRREATACADIDSEHIVGVIDSDVDPGTGRPFLVMELLNGKDLAQYITETWGAGVAIPTSQILTMMRQVASALDKVHAAGIIHRDLKPANLFLVTPDDGPQRVKIVDFGVAKLQRERSGGDGERIGTPLYMAPEQLLKDAAVSAATDVWALALIAYELFVGAPYWEGNTAASLFERIPDHKQHPLPSTLAAARGVKLGPGFDRWLLRCLDPDPAQRPASAGMAVADLFRLFDPNATQPPSKRPGAVPSPIVSDLDDTQRQGRPPRDQYARTEPNIPVAVARNAKPIARSPIRTGPGASPSTGRPAAPTVPTVPTVTDAPAPIVQGSAAPAVEAAERPTIPASRMPMQRVRSPAASSSSGPRVRDASEALTIKMPTVGALHHDSRQTMDPLPLVHRTGTPGAGTGAAQRPTMDPLPLVTRALHAEEPAPKPAPTPKPAPAPKPAKPKDLFAERVSQAAEESENAAAFMADKGRRAQVAGAVTTLLPVVAKPPPPAHKGPLIAAAIVAVGLVVAAGIVLLRSREAPVAAPVVTAGTGLAATDRTSLRGCVAQWSQSLLARPATTGGESAQQFAALLRGHTAGASLAADQQLRLLAALDRTRGPRGWGAAPGGPAPTTEATAWAVVAYAQMAQANHAATALDRVSLAVDSLVALRRADGTFVDAAGRVTDDATAMVVSALVEAKRTGVGATPAAEQARAGVVAQATARLVAGSIPAGVDAMTFWALWQGRPLGTIASADAPDVARAFARTLLARCPAASGCQGAPSWEPWTALALTELLRDPPASLDAPTRQSLVALRALTIGRVGAAREVIARAPTAAVAPWLFAAAELQR
jgi:serine/threonine-protein kinase